MDNNLARLQEVGFVKVGNWILDGDGIACKLHSLSDVSNVLYAFVVASEPVYIGKTSKPLRTRLHGYRSPAPTSSTNVRNKRKIKECLLQSKDVEIFALSDNGRHSYGGFHLNFAVGLEDSLIARLTPPWNGGRKEGLDESLHRVEKLTAVITGSVPPATVLTQLSHPPTSDDFRLALLSSFSRAEERGSTAIEMNAGELHRQVGGYPGVNHRMATCCDVMKKAMKGGDVVLPGGPLKGRGASLTIKYTIPRTP